MCKVCATKEIFAHQKEFDDRKQEGKKGILRMKKPKNIYTF